MSLLNIPTQQPLERASMEQAASSLPKTPSVMDTPPSRNLEYIGKNMALAVQDIYKGINLFSGGVGGALGASAWRDAAFGEIDKPAWLELPSAEHLSIAGRLTGDVTRGLLPFFTPGLGLAVGAGTMASRTGVDLVEQEVDSDTAGRAAAASGLSAVAMAGIGNIVGSGKTVLGTIGRQTAANIPTGMASRAIEQSVLADKYPEIADRVKILGAEEVGLDIALGLLLGGLSHKRVTKGVMDATGKGEAEAAIVTAKAEDIISTDVTIDDAVRTKQTHEQIKQANPIADPDSFDLHMQAIDKAIADVDNLKAVDVSDLVKPEMLKGDLPVMEVPTPDAVLFSQSGVKGSTLTKDQLVDYTKQLVGDKWQKPRFRIVEDVSELPFDVSQDVAGVFNSADGLIYLVSGSIRDTAHARDVILHEMVGHFGLRGFFGDTLDRALDSIHKHNLQIREYADQWVNNNLDLIKKNSLDANQIRYLSIEEAMARMAEEGKPYSYALRLVRVTQQLLRRAGFHEYANRLETKTNAEALQMLRKSELYIKRGYTISSGIPEALYPLFVTAQRPGIHDAFRDNTTILFSRAQSTAASMPDAILESKLVDSIHNKLEGALSRDEIAQVIGTVESRYRFLKTRLTQDQIDIRQEFDRLGIERFSKTTTEQYLAMTPEERVTSLTKAELQKTLQDKKEAIRRQQQSARRLDARRQDMDALQLHDPERTRIEAMIDYLVGHKGGKSNVQNLQAIIKGITDEMMQPLIKPLRPFMDSVFGLRMDEVQYKDLVSNIISPGSTGSDIVKHLAAAITDVNNAIRLRLNSAGADMGFINGYIPQSWARTKVMFAGLTAAETGQLASGIGLSRADKIRLTDKARQTWTENMMRWVNRRHPAYVDPVTGEYFSDAQMKQFLEQAFDTLASDGATKGSGQGGGSLASRLSAERSLFFKDADSFLEANTLYGSADVLTTMVSHMQGRARDLALMENMDAQNFADLLTEAKKLDGKTTGGMLGDLHLLESIWLELSGGRPTAGTGLLADTFRAARQWQVFTKLGSALLSQPTDMATFGLMAAKDGLGFAPAIREMLSAISPLNKADRIAAENLGLAIESVYQDAGSRFMDATNNKGLSAKLAQFTIKAGLMKWWNDSMKRGFHILLGRGMASERGRTYTELDNGFRHMLERNGIDSDAWDSIRRTEPVKLGDREVIAPSLIEDAGHRQKMYAMFADEADYGVIEPGARERALVMGKQESGSLTGEAWKSIALFKMFSITMCTKVIPRLFTNLEGSRLQFAGHMAAYTLAMVGLGAFATQLKEVAKGRNPRDMSDPGFWVAAAGQSGGMGIYGDFIFGDVNRMGQNVATTIAGPLAGTVNDLSRLTIGNVQQMAQGKPTRAAAETLQFIKHNATPNLWYTKQALDTLLFNRAQEAVNPGYLSRMKRRVERENNTSFWWRPGDLLPSSPPDINSAWRN